MSEPEKGIDYYVVIERDEDGTYVGEVPQLRGCYSQGSTLDELMTNIREAIALCLEDEAPSTDGRGPGFAGQFNAPVREDASDVGAIRLGR